MIQALTGGICRDNPLVCIERPSHEVSVSTEGVEELKRISKDKGYKKEDPPFTLLGRNQVNSYAARITKMIADIEDRHHGPIDIEHGGKSAIASPIIEPKRTIESCRPRDRLIYSHRTISYSPYLSHNDILKMDDEDGNFPVPESQSVKASANSDVMYFFTSAQDGDPSQDDVRLCLGDDLKKALDHSKRQA
ncbi:hypothetical protein Tco_0109706 [Tanacetum coccineum]